MELWSRRELRVRQMGVYPVPTCSLLLVCYISSGLWIVSVFRPAGRFLRMTKDPCTVVSVARRSVPLLCFALGYDKSDMTRFTLSLTKKRKSIEKISFSALPRSDMTRSTLPLTKNKNQSKHQLLRLLREVCTVITDCCFFGWRKFLQPYH